MYPLLFYGYNLIYIRVNQIDDMNINVNFYLRSAQKKKPDADRPIQLYIGYAPKKRVKYPTGQSVSADQWDIDTQRVKRSGDNASKVNNRLSEIEVEARAATEAYLKKLRDEAKATGVPIKPIEAGDIRLVLDKVFKAESNKMPTVNEWVVSELDRKIQVSVSKGNESHRTMSNAKFHWLAFTGNKSPTWSEMNLLYFEKFATYLKTVKRKVGRYKVSSSKGLAIAYRRKIVSTILSVLKRGLARGYSRSNAFALIKLNDLFVDDLDNVQPKTSGRYLTFSEIKQLLDLDLSGRTKRINKIRDSFAAACLTGLRHSDWHKTNLKRATVVNGISWQKVSTKKGRNEEKIAIVPLAEIVTGCLRRHKKLNPTYGKINAELRSLGELAGLDRVVTFKGESTPLYECLTTHVARKSFESNMRNLGTPQKLIDLVTTHGVKVTSDRYEERELPELVGPLAKYIMQYEKNILGEKTAVLKLKVA